MGQRRDSNDGSDADDALLLRLIEGDLEALTQFVRRWEAPMFKIAYRVVGQAADAEEVRQIFLLRLLQHPERVPRVSRVDVWLRRCVINEAITWLRRKKRDRFVELDDGNEFAVDSASEPADEEPVDQLRAALNRLTPESRALLALRFDEGLTFREIANVLDKPHTTIHAQYYATIRALRAQLNPDFVRQHNAK